MLKLLNFTPRLDDMRSDQYFLNNYYLKSNTHHAMKIIPCYIQISEYVSEFFQNFLMMG